MNAAQLRAVDATKRLFSNQAERANAGKTADAKIWQAFTFEVKDTEHGTAWLSVREEYPNAPGTILSALSDSWFIHVGKRGGLVAHMYPRSIAQFAGRRWCGIAIKKGDA